MSDLPMTRMAAEESMPEVVYHYTSLSGMMSILRSRTIWASDMSYLNDTLERRIFLDLVNQCLPSFVVDRGWGSSSGATVEDDPEAGNTYVVSFSKAKDSLNQWRSYCPIANGVSIGFRTETLNGAYYKVKSSPRKALDTESLNSLYCDFKKVSYVQPNDSDIGMRLLNSVHRSAEMNSGFAGDTQGVFWGLIDTAVMSEACFYKHAGFSTEEEYRLVLALTAGLHQEEFRCTRSSMVPYVELCIPGTDANGSRVAHWGAVSEIVIGPTPNIDLTTRAVKRFCESIGLEACLITPSTLPYRDW